MDLEKNKEYDSWHYEIINAKENFTKKTIHLSSKNPKN